MPDWAADSPRKLTARKMIQMTETINRANFSDERSLPAGPAIARAIDLPSRRSSMSCTANRSTTRRTIFSSRRQAHLNPDEVLDSYIQAVGGAERVSRLTSFVGKGRRPGSGASSGAPVELYAKAPNQRTVIQHLEVGNKTTTYDGRSGWLASPVTPVPVMTLTGGELEGARLDAELAFPDASSRSSGQWRANLSDDDRRPLGQSFFREPALAEQCATLYFDAESGLLTRVVRYANSAMGRVPTQIDFEDYRDVAGVKIPFKWSFAWLSGRDVIELSDVQANVPIDASKFSKPAPAARP